jgi:dienelactone hydrolase
MQATIDGVRHEVWTSHPAGGPGPDVIVLHEITGATDEFFSYTDTLVDEGFTVHCPVLFGSAFAPRSGLRTVLSGIRACHSREFECNKRSAHTPLNPWLVALSVDISQHGQRRLGAIGMCLTGIQPLAMLRCRAVVAPVLCQPVMPLLAVNRRSARDLGLPPSDTDFALARVQSEQLDVLLVRYAGDRISPVARTDRLRELFNERLALVAVEGAHHSSLIVDPHPTARQAVITFLRSQLSNR